MANIIIMLVVKKPVDDITTYVHSTYVAIGLKWCKHLVDYATLLLSYNYHLTLVHYVRICIPKYRLDTMIKTGSNIILYSKHEGKNICIEDICIAIWLAKGFYSTVLFTKTYDLVAGSSCTELLHR